MFRSWWHVSLCRSEKRADDIACSQGRLSCRVDKTRWMGVNAREPVDILLSVEEGRGWILAQPRRMGLSCGGGWGRSFRNGMGEMGERMQSSSDKRERGRYVVFVVVGVVDVVEIAGLGRRGKGGEGQFWAVFGDCPVIANAG